MNTPVMLAAVRVLALQCLACAALTLGQAHAQDTSPVSRQISGEAGSWERLSVTIPEGADSLNVVLSGDNGDADLYVRFGEEPNATGFDCRPFLGGSS